MPRRAALCPAAASEFRGEDPIPRSTAEADTGWGKVRRVGPIGLPHWLFVLATVFQVVAPSAHAVTFADGQVHVIDANNSFPLESVEIADGPGGQATVVNIVSGGVVRKHSISCGHLPACNDWWLRTAAAAP
jgi:hypothetical protein